VAATAVASTYLCGRFGLLAEFPLTLIATAVVFPIVFSIGGAYKRREAATAAPSTSPRATGSRSRTPFCSKRYGSASSVCSSPVANSSTARSPRCRTGRPRSTPPSRSSRS
jgi:hypothetical protein